MTFYQHIRSGHVKMTLILAVPRSVSSALGRSISQSSDISEYIFQPFYNDSNPTKTVSEYFDQTVQRFSSTASAPAHILVKETVEALSLQRFCSLVEHAHKVIFLVRDPHLQAFSAVKAAYPEYNLGNRENRAFTNLHKVSQLTPAWFNRMYMLKPWQSMAQYVGIAESRVSRNVDDENKYKIVDGDILRNFPEETLRSLAQFLDIEFTNLMLSNWDNTFATTVNTDNNFSTHWVGKAHRTKSLQPTDHPAPAINEFAQKYAEIIRQNLRIYSNLISGNMVYCPANSSLFSKSYASNGKFARNCPVTSFAFTLKMTLENSPHANVILDFIKNENPNHMAAFRLLERTMMQHTPPNSEHLIGVNQRLLLNAFTGASHGIAY